MSAGFPPPPSRDYEGCFILLQIGLEVKRIAIQLEVGVYRNVSLRGTDCLQKSFQSIFFTTCPCVMNIKLFVTKETLYCCSSISATCCQRVNLRFHSAHLLFLFCADMFHVVQLHKILFLLKISTLYNLIWIKNCSCCMYVASLLGL